MICFLVGLMLMFGVANVSGAASAVLDLSDPSQSVDAKLVDNSDGRLMATSRANIKAVVTNGHLYIDVKDGLFSAAKSVWVRVDYFDEGTDSFTVEYDTESDAYSAASPYRTKFDTKSWTQQTFKLLDFSLKGRQEGGSDLRVNDGGDGPEIISKVTVTDEDPEKFHFPKNNPVRPIVLDGVKKEGEWEGAFQVRLDRAEYDVFNGANWGGPQEFSGIYSFKWDEQGLYILGEVTDETPRQNDAAGPNYYNGDGIEQFIGLDQSDPSRTSFQEDTDFQVVIGMGDPTIGCGDGPAWGLWHGGTGIAAEDKGLIPANNVAVVQTEKGYLFELLLPWKLLKSDAQVRDGQEIGWDMFANNSKDCPSSQQVPMTPFRRPNPSTNPSVWATAVLEPIKKVENPPAGP